MKNLLLFALSALLCISQATAQVKKIDYSTPFDEPEDGWNKLLQLSNGNTFFFHFTKKNGIEIAVYGADHKVKQNQVVTSSLWDPKKMASSNIEGLYEIDGKPVIFLHQLTDRTPILYRVILNPQTGAIDNEEQISTLPRYKAGSAWAMAYGGIAPADFYVEKDPASDNYAVVNFNTFAGESDERIEAVYYGISNGKHVRRSQAFYDAQGFKYLNFLGMCVNGDKGVYLCTYGYNTKKSGGEDSRIIVSRLNASSKEFTNKQLEFSDDFKDTKAMLQFNPHSNMLQLLTVTFMKSKSKFLSGSTTNYYLTLMNYIDPQSLFIVTTKRLMNEMSSSFGAPNR